MLCAKKFTKVLKNSMGTIRLGAASTGEWIQIDILLYSKSVCVGFNAGRNVYTQVVRAVVGYDCWFVRLLFSPIVRGEYGKDEGERTEDKTLLRYLHLHCSRHLLTKLLRLYAQRGVCIHLILVYCYCFDES